MKKRIYGNFLCLILATALSLSALLCLYYYSAFKNRETASAKESAAVFARFLNQGGGEALPSAIGADALRVTVIAPDGAVIFDNRSAAESLDNHGDRAEVISALQTGVGEATRHSDTLSAQTYYYAVRLEDANVLRVARTIQSIAGVFGASLPAVLLVTAAVLQIANVLARSLTARIVGPLETLNFDGGNIAAYEELAPYARKIEEQRREIAAQIEALKNRADTILAITQNMKEGLVLIDPRGVALSANQTARALLGETVGQNIRHVCRDLAFAKGVRQCLAGEAAEATLARGGRTYGVYFSPVHSQPRGAVILFMDITAQREAERQRREFSANVSHELKTPLTAISALSEMIASGMAKREDVAGFAAKIAEQVSRLIGVIDDIIKLSEFDEGRGESSREPFDLYALAESVAEALRENGKGVTVRVVGDPFPLLADRRMIEELLYNLMDNGIKYNKEGGEVTVTLSREDDRCKIAVADTGIGIPEAHRRHVFERFYRADKSRSKKTGGTGLGLSIVKHIAERHGGGVELTSEEGVGTTVVCWVSME